MPRPKTTRPNLVQIRVTDAEKKQICDAAQKMRIAPATAAAIILGEALDERQQRQRAKQKQ